MALLGSCLKENKSVVWGPPTPFTLLPSHLLLAYTSSLMTGALVVILHYEVAFRMEATKKVEWKERSLSP